MPRNQFTLTGTAVIDQKQIAFLRENAGGKARTVRVGETINGVLVAEVKPDRVRLVMGNENEELTLKLAAGPRQTVQPQVPVAAGAPGQPPGPRPQVPGQPVAADPVAEASANASILERRRAARAALQAQQEAAASTGEPGTLNPGASGGLPPRQNPTAAQRTLPAPRDSADFAEAARRRQQQRGLSQQ